jgi:GDP-L-fucose synthase
MPTNLYGPHDNFNLQTSHVLPALIRKMHLGKCLEKGDLESAREDLLKQGDHEIVIGDSRFVLRQDIQEETILKILEFYGIRTADHGSRKTVVTLWGTGNPYREFLYVDDLAEACVALMEKYRSREIGEFVNIGTGGDVMIRELAEFAKEAVGFKGQIVWDASKPDGTPRKLLDVSKIKSLGWKPKTSLEEGIRKTYEWYISGK